MHQDVITIITICIFRKGTVFIIVTTINFCTYFQNSALHQDVIVIVSISIDIMISAPATL